MNNIEIIKELNQLLKESLFTLETLKSYCDSNEVFIENKDNLIILRETHLKTREQGRLLIENDFERLSKNIFFKLIAKDLKPTFIMYINLITDLIEKGIVLSANGTNLKDIDYFREEVILLEKECNKKFKKIKNQDF